MSSPMFTLPAPYIRSAQARGRTLHSTNGSRKRKRDRGQDPTSIVDDLTEDDLASQQETGEPHQERRRSGSSRNILTPDDIYQYRVAGQLLEDSLPDHNFPHTSGRRPYQRTTETALHQDERGRTQRSRHDVSLRQQHLSVITTILHRCILEQDFERAGRALGLLLRDEIGGHTIDIRTQGRWGIGAEILLRRGQDRQVDEKATVVTRPGFEMARKYYERLNVQHPYNKISGKHAYDERDFNLALLGLRIYMVHQDGKTSREGGGREEEEDEEAMDEDARLSGVREELEGARNVARKLDDLMISPLYSQHVEYIRLRAMVALWVADLSREHQILEQEAHDFDQPLNTTDDQSVEDDPVEDFSNIHANMYRRNTGRRPMGRNVEAEESQMIANDLFAKLASTLQPYTDG